MSQALKIISESPRHVVSGQVLLGLCILSSSVNTALGLEGQMRGDGKWSKLGGKHSIPSKEGLLFLSGPQSMPGV